MNDILIRAAQVVLSLSLLIVLHELGHFLPAKWFKTRVEKFYLFFNPWFSLFKVKRGETVYGLGWLPLGGYVKIAGMVDESMDTEQLAKDPEPWEFRSKPAWQRLIIMVGGVVVNIIVGIVIYAMLLFSLGEKHLSAEKMTDGVWVTDSLGLDLGFQTGDQLVSINGEPIPRFRRVMFDMLSGGEVEIKREGKSMSIPIPEDFVGRFIDGGAKPMLAIRTPFLVDSIPDTSLNAKSGLRKGDRFVSVEGQPITYFDEFQDVLADRKGQQITAQVQQGDEAPRTLNLQLNDKGKVEFGPHFLTYSEMHEQGIYDFKIIEYSFFGAFPAGIRKAVEIIEMQIIQFRLIFRPETGAYKGVGGIGAIGKLFKVEWNWTAFWETTALLSLILAFMNILPIPALDGGHVMFLLYEMVSGRAPGQKFQEYAQLVGFVLLLTLIVYANGNDVVRAFFKG